MRVSIEREVCTGSGDCARAVPDVFWMAEDGLATVKEEAAHFGETVRHDGDDEATPGHTAWVRVPESLEDAVDAAAANCPGACILIEQPAPEPEPVVEDAVADEPEADPVPAPKRSFYRRVRGRVGRMLK